MTKYNYDYPENRKLGEKLTSDGIRKLMSITGLSRPYMHRIFVYGDRTNELAIKIAKIIIGEQDKMDKEIYNAINNAKIIDLRRKLKKITEKLKV